MQKKKKKDHCTFPVKKLEDFMKSNLNYNEMPFDWKTALKNIHKLLLVIWKEKVTKGNFNISLFLSVLFT